MVFYAGAVWETGRFFFLFQFVSAVANPRANPLLSLLLLWLSSGQLCAALLFFLCGYMPGRFFSLRKITAVFVFLGILPPLLMTAGRHFFVFPGESLSVPARILPGFAAALVIVVVDVLFLAFLLLSREGAECT
jgi:hypothetical protein